MYKEPCLLSVIGPHAGESVEQIFKRKIEDADKLQQTFWVFKSYFCTPDMVHRLCQQRTIKCYFLEPKSRGGSAPTTGAEVGTEYSSDRRSWTSLPVGLSPVTGKLGRDGATALVLKSIVVSAVPIWIDLNRFNNIANGTPVAFRQGGSTVCAEPRENSIGQDLRQIAAIAELCEPFCVWVR